MPHTRSSSTILPATPLTFHIVSGTPVIYVTAIDISRKRASIHNTLITSGMPRPGPEPVPLVLAFLEEFAMKPNYAFIAVRGLTLLLGLNSHARGSDGATSFSVGASYPRSPTP